MASTFSLLGRQGFASHHAHQRSSPRNHCTVAIPGLYAAGELVGGLFYFNYPGGTGLVSGSVFGKIAGTTAGGQVGRNQ